jgi:hypothetical protein
MATCDVCGNDYDKAFRITQAGKTMTFDSFECAIHAMAPRWRTASVLSSGMASRTAAPFIAAPIARSNPVSKGSGTERLNSHSVPLCLIGPVDLPKSRPSGRGISFEMQTVD